MQLTNLDTLLLVEDEADHADLIREALQEEGHLTNEIVWLKNGLDAVQYVSGTGRYADQPHKMPGLILLDLKLPEMDGFEVLHHLKSHDEYQQIPIVVLTTSSNSEDVKKALRLGANDYIVKPVLWQDFERKIRELGKYWAFISNTALSGRT